MAFMKPVVEHGSWYVVDGPAGTEYVPADLVGTMTTVSPGEEVTTRFPSVDEMRDLEQMTGSAEESNEDSVRFPIPTALLDYCENRECWSVELREGWGARLTAPGYLDCTPWSVFDTREEAEASLRDQEDES